MCIAHVVRILHKRYMEGDDIANSCDVIEGNTDSFGRIIEEHFETLSLCHLGDQRTHMVNTDDTDRRRI